jgi:SAM-dependent methyltransferase
MAEAGRRKGPGQALVRFATRNAVRRQRRVWSGRVASWDKHGSAGLAAVTAAVLEAVDVEPDAQVVDLGCGTGQISLPLATHGARVLAVDVSPAMVRRLESQARGRGAGSLDGLVMPIEELALPARSVDLVVSSYALHHLRDADKARLVSAAYRWLRPGGRLMIADMMFGRGGSRADRAIIRSKVATLARQGPGGWWRIAKNTVRYLLRVQERPVSVSRWTAMLTGAGFTEVTAATIRAEAGLVTGRRPEDPGSPDHGGMPPRPEVLHVRDRRTRHNRAASRLPPSIASGTLRHVHVLVILHHYGVRMLNQVMSLARLDFSPQHRQPAAARVVLATVAALVGSLAADALLVVIGDHIFPATRGYAHFRFSDYCKLTVIGVIIACIAWPVVTRVTSHPRWLFFRLAILVTLVLWLPDLYILYRGSRPEAVAVLMIMHLAIALVTYNLLVHVAPVRPGQRDPAPRGHLTDASGRHRM